MSPDAAGPGDGLASRRRQVVRAGQFEEDVRRVLVGIPPGTVLTYGEVALEAGHPGAARAVGTLLARGSTGLPWWRVVTSTGRLVPGIERRHSRLLRDEGVRVVGDRVVMSSRTGRPDRKTRQRATR